MAGYFDPSWLLSPLRTSKRSYSKLGLQARRRSRKGRGHWNLCSKASPAASRLRQAFRWRGPLSAGQGSPAPSSVGDQWAGHPSGPGTTAGQTAPPCCWGGDKGAKESRKGREKASLKWRQSQVGPVTPIFPFQASHHSLAPNCSLKPPGYS